MGISSCARRNPFFITRTLNLPRTLGLGILKCDQINIYRLNNEFENTVGGIREIQITIY